MEHIFLKFWNIENVISVKRITALVFLTITKVVFPKDGWKLRLSDSLFYAHRGIIFWYDHINKEKLSFSYVIVPQTSHSRENIAPASIIIYNS